LLRPDFTFEIFIAREQERGAVRVGYDAPRCMVEQRILLWVFRHLAACAVMMVMLFSSHAVGAEEARPVPEFNLGGYIEAAYTHAFEEPSNGIINYRGFDNRHGSFTLSNLALDATGRYGPVSARIALQVGHTPNFYYLAEPSIPATGGAGESSFATWKIVQQAYASMLLPVARGLTVDAGIFLSPIGFEGLAVKDNWNYSRSNLFVGLPFYHTGLRATLEVSERLSLQTVLCNGWNSIVDNNDDKSLITSITYQLPERFSASLFYMGGVERPQGAPEGRPFRHLFDAVVQVDVNQALSVAAHGTVGFEKNRMGTSKWQAAALYARARPLERLYVAARLDAFWEQVPEGASPIFWPVSWVGSGTLSADVRPYDHISLRLEYRHDRAAGDIYFEDEVEGDGSTARPYVPNSSTQNTITAGMTAWF